MAATTLVETFKVLRDSEEWLSGIEIAFKSGKGERACREAAKRLENIGVVSIKLIDKRQYFLMSPLSTKQDELPLIVDIKETIIIKGLKNANVNNQDNTREGKSLSRSK